MENGEWSPQVAPSLFGAEGLGGLIRVARRAGIQLHLSLETYFFTPAIPTFERATPVK